MDKKINYDDYFVWMDHEVRFDISKQLLALRTGEKTIETLQNIEDTKGNNGDIGTMMFTNLRIIWYSLADIKINLSIGYDNILNSDIKSAISKVKGEAKSLFLKCKFNNNRFEFIFTAVSNNSPQIFTVFQNIYKAFDTTRLYRELKIKGFLTQDKSLITLPQEKIISKMLNISNVSNDQAIPGIFYVTNVRIVWFSTQIDSFNVSLPWIHIRNIKLKETKNGRLIFFEINKYSGGNVLAFKFNDNVDTVLKELLSSYYSYLEYPIFGIDISAETINPENERENMENFKNLTEIKDDVEIVETNYFNDQSNMMYYLTQNVEKKNTLNEIVFSQELGVAIEKLPEGLTLNSLWKIIPN